MSIATRTGDGGTTALMYGRRLSKCHPRVEAYGGVDELNAALGLVRVFSTTRLVNELVLAVQEDLVALMGELATAAEDQERYAKEGYARLGADSLKKLDDAVKQMEERPISFKGWATPGGTPASAHLDLARGVCRRAERNVCRLRESGEPADDAIIRYLNRLSDVLWLFARLEAKDVVSGSAAPNGPSG